MKALNSSLKTQNQPKFGMATGAILQRKCACGKHAAAGGECEECARKKERLQRKSQRTAEVAGVPSDVCGALRSAGESLDASTRGTMESFFGRDFSQVRIHTGPRADASARSVDALAYTVGNNVVFGAGQYAPRSRAGNSLLVHELAHVVQQGGRQIDASPVGGLEIDGADSPAEKEADIVARSFDARGVPASPKSNVTPRLQRQKKGAASPIRKQFLANPIVEIVEIPGPGQMTRIEFLSKLESALLQSCEEELAPYGYTSKNCPFIVRSIQYYARQPLSALLRIVQKFGKAPAGTSAEGLIGGVVASARRVARNLAQRRFPRLQSAGEHSGSPQPMQNPFAVKSQLGTGASMERGLQARMEKTFATSFEDVRLHTYPAAERVARGLRARAFTIGNEIAFGENQYQPETSSGQYLIAHELAHTIQQDPDKHGRSRRAAYSTLEHEANSAAEKATRDDAGIENPQLSEADFGVQKIPAAALVVALEVGEVAVVATEVAAVSTEVVVGTEGVLLLTAAEATPLVVSTAVEAAPAVVATTEATVAASTAASTLTAATAIAAASTTLSSDSSSSSKENEQRDCFRQNPFAMPCEFEVSLDEAAQDFLLDRGYDPTALGSCYRAPASRPDVSEPISACNGAPPHLVRFMHCDVSPDFDPIAGRSLSGGILSAFGCPCCRTDGRLGTEWRGLHWSPGNMSK